MPTANTNNAESQPTLVETLARTDFSQFSLRRNTEDAANYTVYAALCVILKQLETRPFVYNDKDGIEHTMTAQQFSAQVVRYARYKVEAPKMDIILGVAFLLDEDGRRRINQGLENDADWIRNLKQSAEKGLAKSKILLAMASVFLATDIMIDRNDKYVRHYIYFTLFLLCGIVAWLNAAPALINQPKLTKLIENNFSMPPKEMTFLRSLGITQEWATEQMYDVRDGAMPRDEFVRRNTIVPS